MDQWFIDGGGSVLDAFLGVAILTMFVGMILMFVKAFKP